MIVFIDWCHVGENEFRAILTSLMDYRRPRAFVRTTSDLHQALITTNDTGPIDGGERRVRPGHADHPRVP